MTEKRFTFDIDNENGTDDPYFCNGIDSFYVDNADEMELFIKEINELVEENKKLKKENQHIKNTIQEAYNNERTQLGKSVLKQLIQNIGDINE